MGVGEVRSAAEVAGLRAAAREAARQGEYRATVSAAVTATLDWLDGTTARAPFTGDEAAPERARVTRERTRAEDAERDARRTGGDSVTPGIVAQTIAWWRRGQYAEPPLIF